jgi:hypothetical protein
MWENFVRAREYSYTTFDKSQNWYANLYPWSLGTNSRINKRIGDTL